MTRKFAELAEGTRDDMVKQLYACGSVAIRTETETELTCDMERNIQTDT